MVWVHPPEDSKAEPPVPPHTCSFVCLLFSGCAQCTAGPGSSGAGRLPSPANTDGSYTSEPSDGEHCSSHRRPEQLCTVLEGEDGKIGWAACSSVSQAQRCARCSQRNAGRQASVGVGRSALSLPGRYGEGAQGGNAPASRQLGDPLLPPPLGFCPVRVHCLLHPKAEAGLKPVAHFQLPLYTSHAGNHLEAQEGEEKRSSGDWEMFLSNSLKRHLSIQLSLPTSLEKRRNDKRLSILTHVL